MLLTMVMMLSAGAEKPEPNAREVAEAYLGAALAGKPSNAVKLAVEGQSPSREEGVDKLKTLLAVDKLALAKVLVTEKQSGRAFAVSEVIKVKEPGKEDQSGCLIIALNKTPDGWRVKDLDFKSEEVAKARTKAFLDRNDDAKEIPAAKKN